MSDLLTVTDQMNREVTFSFPPKRIISLVPSQTEFLLDIGAPVVGRTKFCVHPAEGVEGVDVVGGTKKFRFDKIKELKPDLIIGNKEENYLEGIEELSKEFSVWMSDIFTLQDAFEMMSDLGKICDLETESARIANECQVALDKVKGKYTGKVIYLIWKDPWMAAGKNTFIDHMLGFLGYENLVVGERYPSLTDQQIVDLNPDKILFSSEPYPFKDSDILKANSQWLPIASGTNSQLVDGELHSWYGSRLKNWQ